MEFAQFALPTPFPLPMLYLAPHVQWAPRMPQQVRVVASHVLVGQFGVAAVVVVYFVLQDITPLLLTP